MTKRSKTIGIRLSIAKESTRAPSNFLIRKCETFLKNIPTISKTLSAPTAALQLLDVRKRAATRIARRICVENLRRKAGISDSAIDTKEICIYQKTQILKLNIHAKAIIEILYVGLKLPPSAMTICEETSGLYITPAGTAGRKKIQESLCSTLKRLVTELDKEPRHKISKQRFKKGKAPLRLDAIRSLASVARVENPGFQPGLHA